MAGSGDKAELTRLVLEHMEDALRLATRLCGDAHQAEDVVQEALYRVVRGWSSFRRQSQFRTWLFRIVVNAVHDSRRTRRDWQILSEDLPESRAGPASSVTGKELESVVADCIVQLPPRQKETLILRIVEGLSAAEVAEILETNEANVHATLHAARKKLKQQLAPYMDHV